MYIVYRGVLIKLNRTEGDPLQLVKTANKPILPRNTQVFITFGFIAIFIFSILFSLGHGQADISFTDIWQILLYKTTHGSLGSIDNINQSIITKYYAIISMLLFFFFFVQLQIK